MESTLNVIIDNARTATAAGVPALNVYPAGTLRHLAYALGTSPNFEATVLQREDGQVYAVADLGEGEYASVVPSDLADRGLGKTHGSLRDAVDYLLELARLHGDACTEMAA